MQLWDSLAILFQKRTIDTPANRYHRATWQPGKHGVRFTALVLPYLLPYLLSYLVGNTGRLGGAVVNIKNSAAVIPGSNL